MKSDPRFGQYMFTFHESSLIWVNEWVRSVFESLETIIFQFYSWYGYHIKTVLKLCSFHSITIRILPSPPNHGETSKAIHSRKVGAKLETFNTLSLTDADRLWCILSDFAQILWNWPLFFATLRKLGSWKRLFWELEWVWIWQRLPTLSASIFPMEPNRANILPTPRRP